jgi:hypothetical protein
MRVPLSPSAVDWQVIGSGLTISSGGIASAIDIGEGSVTATYGVLTDSASVRVVAPRGSILMGPMDYATWTLITEYMDSSGTLLGPASGGSGMALQYRLTYRQTNANKYLVRLRPQIPMLVPGRADTVKLWFSGDGQNHAVLYQIADRDGEWFPTIPRRVNWFGEWRPVAARIDPGSGRFDLPAAVDEIDIYLVPAVAPADGTVVEGMLELDSLHALFRPRPTSSVHPTASAPRIACLRSFPNPFNPTTTIRYELPAAAPVRLEIFDLMGRRLAVLINGRMAAAGAHEVAWSGEDAPSGVYVACLTTPNERITNRLMLLR